MLFSRLIYLVLALLALLVLAPGIWEPTGLSGKDEYFLGLRTPMEMMARQEWLVPFLDGAPRIRKPPMLYWLGRSSYEIFGISLTSARMITVLFSVLLVLSTVGIARRLLPRIEHAWIAGGILLACLGLHTESRRFMLDIPVVALSTAAFWVWLIWLEKHKAAWLTLATLLLAAGFMIKGPVVFLVFLAGIVALHSQARTLDVRIDFHGLSWKKRSLWIVLHIFVLAALCTPWFVVVRELYPAAVEAVVADEVGSRQFMTLTPGIMFGLLNISLPWFFVFWVAVFKRHSLPSISTTLVIWFAITFIPFLFFKSFDRYLLGSLVPLALLVSLLIETPIRRPVWAFRAGLLIALLLGTGLAGISFWFDLPGWAWLIPGALYLAWAWYWPQHRAVSHLLFAPMLFWLALLWGVFPGLGVGSIPPEWVEKAKTQSVAFYDGPQPALLPILSGQAHRHVPRLSPDKVAGLGTTPIMLDARAMPALERDVLAAGYTLSQLDCYLTLASHGSGIRFARPGSTWDDWKAAFAQRDLSPIKTQICAFQIGPRLTPP